MQTSLPWHNSVASSSSMSWEWVIAGNLHGYVYKSKGTEHGNSFACEKMKVSLVSALANLLALISFLSSHKGVKETFRSFCPLQWRIRVSMDCHGG
jgi:hypothetical protein